MPERRVDDGGMLLVDPWSFPVDSFVGQSYDVREDSRSSASWPRDRSSQVPPACSSTVAWSTGGRWAW
jgi:hypothetical protein